MNVETVERVAHRGRWALVLGLTLGLVAGCDKPADPAGQGPEADTPFVEGLVIVYRVPVEYREAIEGILGERLERLDIAYRFEPGGTDTIAILMPREARVHRAQLEADLGKPGQLSFLPVVRGRAARIGQAIHDAGAPGADEEHPTEALPEGLLELGRAATFDAWGVVLTTTEGHDPVEGLRQLMAVYGDVLDPGEAVVYEDLPAVDAKRSAQALVVHGRDALRNVQIESALAKQGDGGAFVRIVLAPAHAKAFLALTEAHVEEKIAIVMGDQVLLAPIVREPIAGGEVQLLIGAGAPDGQLAQARVLAAVLSGPALPASIELLAVMEPEVQR